jgi:photosystem II stability/assembly factor-like uncharacterized protein
MAKRLGFVIALVLAVGVFFGGGGDASPGGYENLPGWHWVAGGTLRGVSFASSTSGWAVGDGGLIIRSTDGGMTWRPLASGTKVDLRHVQFLDDDHGWTVGEDGTIVATDDSGSTWGVQTAPTGEDLHQVHFVDASHGWAVGDGGTILVTQNGGLQWTSQASGTTVNLYGVDFVDGTHGWAVGAQGTVIATTDGGSIWNDQPTCDESHDLYDVDFVDRNDGWIAGWGSALWTTSDGGTNWGEWILSGWTRNLYALELADADHGWAVGEGGFVARYEYPSWTEQTSSTDADLFDLEFVDAQWGWAVGDAGTVLSTTDEGATWERRIGSTTGEVNGLYFVDENRGWAAVGWSVSGFPGELLHTSDGGATWTVQKNGVPYLNDVQFVAPYRGWAVGGAYGDGTILATTDGGTHWDAQTYPTSGPMRGVHFVGPDDGWAVGGAVGGNGWILGTTNGGNDWTLQKTTYSVPLYDVCFGDLTHGWAVGANGNIWATLNGTDWFTQTSGITETLSGLTCYDQLGWAVGDGTILATRDGGNTWAVQDSGYPTATFADVDFNGPGWGWVVGVEGASYESLILATGDQGNTWLPEEMPLDAGLLRSVHAFRRGRGPVIWAGGSNGLILSNQPDPTIPVSTTVSPAEGGAIFSSDGSTSLIFPAGAVSDTVTITHTPRTASQLPSTGELTGYRMFALTAVYSGTTTPASIVPGTCYTISVDYAGAVVVNDARLGLYSWSASAWVKEPTSSADYDESVVTANPDHFSYFAVLGKSYFVYLPIALKNHPQEPRLSSLHSGM